MNTHRSILILYTVALVFVGCTSSVQVVDETVPTPVVRIDTVVVKETERVFVASPCDTGAILDLLCVGEASGTTDGIEWKVKYEKVAREFNVLNAKARRLADSVHVLVNRPEGTQPLPESLREQIAALKANQERHTWRDTFAYIGAGFLSAIVLGVIAGIALKFKPLWG